MPSCTVCGYAVEWSRHCYSADWRLFKNDLGITTRGYYYFTADDVPFYPGFTNLGSADWYDKNAEIIDGLGEVKGSPRLFHNGRFSGTAPAPRLVGSADCIANGDALADAVDTSTLVNGYPLKCYVPLEPEPPLPLFPRPRDFENLSAWDRCEVAKLWARIIDKLYVGEATEMTDILNDVLQGPATITYLAPRENFPATCFVIGPDYVLVAADGTRNFQQLAMQTMQSVGGPTNIGIFGTQPLWYNAGQDIHRRLLAAGVTDQRRIFFVGHSYGAAAVLSLAGMYRFVNPNRVIKYLTYGCPKIGDLRLVRLVAACSGQSLRNDNDVVTAIPPDTTLLAQLGTFFPLIILDPWGEWLRPPHSLTQDEDGKLIAGGSFELSVPVALDIVRRGLAGQTFSQVLGHGIDEYIRRIDLRCPGQGWPVSEPIEQINDEAVWTASLLSLGNGPEFAPLDQLLAVGGQVTGMAIFDTPVIFNWTAPPNVHSVTAIMKGSGGKGGAGSGGITPHGGGGGGGAGFGIGTLAVTPGNTYIGRVALGGSSGGASLSRFSGDGGTLRASGGVSGSAGTSGGGGLGGAGGVGSTLGSVSNVFLGTGGTGGVGDLSGGGGGGAAGFGSNGAPGAPGGTNFGGNGGAAGDGSGNGGRGGDAITGSFGIAGSNAGGAGGGNPGVNTGTIAGANGVVYLVWRES